MGDVKMRRENIRYEARGKSFEIECPQGFAGIEAIVCWCDAGGGWHHEAFESFLDARGRLDGLLRGEAVMAYVQRTVCMKSASADRRARLKGGSGFACLGRYVGCLLIMARSLPRV